MKKNKNKSKSFLIIGMGRFGKHLAYNLQKLGNDVMAIDKEEKIIQEISTVIEDVIVGDCMDENVVRSIGVANFDMCFVTIGKNFESSLIVTSRLKTFGARHIVTKAGRDLQIDMLKKIGADEVVYPEREFAEKLAMKYGSDNIFDYIILSDDYTIFEIGIPDKWDGKTIGEINIRQKYKINVIAVKSGNKVKPSPGADYTLQKSDIIVIVGKNTDVERLEL